jgi:hypothetical protein
MSGDDDLGAYGFRIRGLEGAAEWMQPQAEQPLLEVVVAIAEADGSASRVDERSADISLIGGGRLRATRDEGIAAYHLPAIPPVADLLHPYLAPGAALAAKWAGLEALHAGGFVTAEGAVLLLGDKEAGKSTTLAWLAKEGGVGVVADDMIVLDRGAALSGPRLIDIRPGGSATGPSVRDGTRVRERLADVALRTPAAGTVVLEWGDEVGTRVVAPADRLALLADSRMFPALTGDPSAVLELAAQPMFTLTRPRSHDALPAAGAKLLTLFG